ncbi:hypothetical protein GGF50DRAFT_90769 [Schizophyllum commune]
MVFAADDFAAAIAALNLVGSIGQVIRRQSVKAHVKKDAVLVNAVHELLEQHMDDIQPDELDKLLKDVQLVKENCKKLKPLSEKFVTRWNPFNIITAREITRACKDVLESCQSASNTAIEVKLENKIASNAAQTETRAEVSVSISRAGQHIPMPPLRPDVLASSLASPPTLIHIGSHSTLQRRRAVDGLDDGESIYSRASSKRSQRWHVVRSPTQQQIMDDLSGLSFGNASVSSFLVSPDGVEELTGDAAFTSGQLSELVHGAPNAEQVNEFGLPQPTRRLRRQMTMMSLVSTTTLPEDFASEKQNTISGLDIPFDGQSSLLA